MLSKILNKFVTCTILLYQLNTKNKILIVKYILIFNVLVGINLFASTYLVYGAKIQL